MFKSTSRMDMIRETAERWIEKLKITTNMLLELDDDVKLPNNWGKRELLIHLSGWDGEFINFASEMRKKIKFYPFYEENGEEKNHQFFQENHDLDLISSVKRFKVLRTDLVEVYEEVLNHFFQENREFVGFFSIWWHDAHHLKQAGCDISHLEE